MVNRGIIHADFSFADRSRFPLPSQRETIRFNRSVCARQPIGRKCV